MKMNKACVVIPAVKKNVAFTDDLVKKLAGIPLIQRAIDKAKILVASNDVYVVTDSEEIRLISERSNVRSYYDKDLHFEGAELFSRMKFFVIKIARNYDEIILLSPYAPLLSADVLKSALSKFRKEKVKFLLPVKRQSYRIFRRNTQHSLPQLVFDDPFEEIFIELQAFQIFRSELVFDSDSGNNIIPVPYELESGIEEINSFHDWWVCEKLLRRKRIVFRVIGNEKVGMGHIFRALALAHEITDHEIRFICDDESGLAVNKLAGYDYWLEVCHKNEIEERIISLQPDMVINDILNTTKEYILNLRRNNIRVVNFEDLGSGAPYADLTINELYDEPLLEGDHILWGYNYFFLRDEFHSARPHEINKPVDSILISFGGTDQNDFTRKTLRTILQFCKESKIKINIVTGEGYLYKDALLEDIARAEYNNINFTCATGVMSRIMEQSQIAITSNGRTVYELAHMNIPAIVLAHHPRENTHCFATESRGFINLGLYKSGKTEEEMLSALKRLVLDDEFRAMLIGRMKSIRFTSNKKKVLKLILDLLEGPSR